MQTTTETTTTAGCGCLPVADTTPQQLADTLQARAISGALDEYGITARYRSVGYDHQVHAVAVRVDTAHGLYALLIPAVGRQFPVLHNGQRAGALDCRRVPAVTDSRIGAEFAMFLRDRAEL